MTLSEGIELAFHKRLQKYLQTFKAKYIIHVININYSCLFSWPVHAAKKNNYVRMYIIHVHTNPHIYNMLITVKRV